MRLISEARPKANLLRSDDLSTTWAVATLAFVSFLVVALVYVLYFFGPWLRKRSKLARNF